MNENEDEDSDTCDDVGDSGDEEETGLDKKGNPRLYRLSVPFSDYDFRKNTNKRRKE